MMILKATETNRGLTGPGDWEKTKWKEEDTGWYQNTTTFRATDELFDVELVMVEGMLSDSQFEELKGLLAQDWTTESTYGVRY